jgi:putative ATP-dependent endonuclease of the OLD family
MKLRRIKVENVLSFLEPTELLVDGNMSIIVGPNAGGKTNLLDIVTGIIRGRLLLSWSLTESSTDIRQFSQGDVSSQLRALVRHKGGGDRPQKYEIELEVTEYDCDNMKKMKASAQEFANRAKQKYDDCRIIEANEWNLSVISVGQRLTYKMVNTASPVLTEDDVAEATYLNYLNLYEVDAILRQEYNDEVLSMPMLYMPTNRTIGQVESSVSLSQYEERKSSIDHATSKSRAQLISFAIGRMAIRHRLLLESGQGDEFKNDQSMKDLTNKLESLGYEWELKSTNPMSNKYDLVLTKRGISFSIGEASSGEKEILTYLLAIYVLNVRNALIVIDEPELHLHPQWQTVLLSLFKELADKTGNQFLMSTHSPTFISPDTIHSVSRVFSDQQQSKIVNLSQGKLPEEKNLVSIVNSLNNEKIFFVDKVVLVEGILDRIFFEAVFRKLDLHKRSDKTCEIVIVGGKGNFSHYKKILDAFDIPHAIIADHDYLKQIGSDEIKSLFSLNNRRIKETLDDPNSRDGKTLISDIDDAIKTDNMEKLRDTWAYIEKRYLKERNDWSDEDRSHISKFIETKREGFIFILSQGDLEEYLPKEIGSDKDSKKLIEFTKSDNFWSKLSDNSQKELSLISEKIEFLENPMSQS